MCFRLVRILDSAPSEAKFAAVPVGCTANSMGAFLHPIATAAAG
jgi:hypothetical protein